MFSSIAKVLPMTFYNSAATVLLLLTATLTAQAQTFSSNDKQVSILELYTSEGCSSCPPADKWLSQLKQDNRLWTEVIPMAFHVDYWDYIGWQDPYANPKFSQRQRQFANQKQQRTIYTPGMLLNGKEWRSWFYFRPLSLDSNNNAGKLTINTKDNRISAKYTAKKDSKKSLILNVAILGFDLVSSINAGENEGKTLTHDFVVIGHKSIKMSRFGKDYVLPQTDLPTVKTPAKKTAIASWVSTANDLTPIQATGGWLTR